MSPEAREAADRIHASLKGRHPRNFYTTVEREDADGNLKPERAHVTPWAENMAGDVAEVASAVPMDRMDGISKILWRSTKDLEPQRTVINQTQDLWHLLGLIGITPEEQSTPGPAAGLDVPDPPMEGSRVDAL